MGAGQRRRPCIESEGETGMMNMESALRSNPQVNDYKINIHKIKSYELFFVKGKLETVRCTNTCDTEVTVYVAHDDFLGDAQFFVYPSTSDSQLNELIKEAVEKAKLICNKAYTLPENEVGCFEVESNFSEFCPEDLASEIANTVFSANTVENGSLNSVEIFVNCHTESVCNSRGIKKTQVRYDAMVEAIPTYNGSEQSVELYEQYNFSNLDIKSLYQEIADMMVAVKARYEAIKPEKIMVCNVILNKLELSELFENIARNLHYSSVYTRSGKFQKGDAIQEDPTGDKISITMAGHAKGNINSAQFDRDGMALHEMLIVENGKAVNYYGDNRFGQYLGEAPTGNMKCLLVSVGSANMEEFEKGPYLEVISMSGLQVDFFSDYIGGEIRLAYYHDGEKMIPVTGISISGSVHAVLNTIRLSSWTAVHGGYMGPEKAILSGLKIF